MYTLRRFSTSKITPTKVEYNLLIADHRLKASAEHLELARRITFYFDDKIVAEKAIPPGDFLTDDDCISEIVENYCKNKTGVYADLFKNHSDRVHLVSKTLDFEIENYGLKMEAHVEVEKGRIFTTTLAEISENFSVHINELSSDKVEEWIKWED